MQSNNSQYNMCRAYYFGSNPGWKKMRFQLPLNTTFCRTPQPFTHQQLIHFSETVQVFSNNTPITQSSINPQQNKNQPPLAYSSRNTPHTKLCHLACGRSEGELSNPGGNKRKSWTHVPSSFHMINTRYKKDKTLHSPSFLLSFSCTRNKKKKNSSTSQERVTRVSVVHKSWIAKCFPRFWDFSQSNKHPIHGAMTQ